MAHQTFFDGMENSVQTEMMPEYQGKGSKPNLIDVNKFKEQQELHKQINALKARGQRELI